MRVQDIMTKGVEIMAPTTRAEDAWQLMRQKRIHHLVVKEGANLVGVLSATDAGGPNGAALREGRVVADLMRSDIAIVDPETTVQKAANLMRGRASGCVVVRSGSRLAGIVTISDLLELIGRGADRGAGVASRPPLHHRAPHRKRHTSTGAW